MHVLGSKKEQITLEYGNQMLNGEPYNHTGLDMVKQTNSLDTIIAIQSGKVITVVNKYKGRNLAGGYGNYIVIQHGNGFTTKYCHLKYNSIKVSIGDIVKKEQEIAYMGETGDTFGAHLHFEVLKNGKTTNPKPYIKGLSIIPAYKETNALTVGNYKTLDVMRVRAGAGTNYRQKKVKELTADGKKNATSSNENAYACYKKGTIFTAMKITVNTDGSVWAQSPSGYICLKDSYYTYCEKV